MSDHLKRYISMSVRLVIAPYHDVDNSRVGSVVNWKQLLYDECFWWKKIYKKTKCFFDYRSLSDLGLIQLVCLDRDHLRELELNDHLKHVLQRHGVFVRSGRSLRHRPCAPPPHRVQTLLRQRTAWRMKYSHRLLAALWEMSFSSHIIPGLYTQVYWGGEGIPYSMANCKMQAPHRFRIPLQRRWRIKATFWTLYILWLYWAVDWLPVWLPPKARGMSSRMQAHAILLQMSSFKSRPQSHCDCLNIMNSPKRTKTICGSFWTPFQNVQYQRWLKS